MMAQNVGFSDRIARVVIALALLVLIQTNVLAGAARTIAMILALALIITTISGFCPLYLLLKFSTKKR